MTGRITPAKRANMEPELAAIIATARKAAARHHVSVRAVISTAMAASVCSDGLTSLDFIPMGDA